MYAVEFSHRSGRDLINVAKKRTNVVPIIEDARHPHKYRMLMSELKWEGSTLLCIVVFHSFFYGIGQWAVLVVFIFCKQYATLLLFLVVSLTRV